jgi:hypothetical protein
MAPLSFKYIEDSAEIQAGSTWPEPAYFADLADYLQGKQGDIIALHGTGGKLA